MKGKKVLITSGGCLEKWDNVRGHTNMAKGTIGRLMAEEALSQGASVIYLHGYFAQKPSFTEGSALQLCSFEGILDLQEKMKEILTNEQIDVVIMAAAGSDWIVDKMLTQDGEVISHNGKISSDNPPIIHFKKTPKVINQIKSWSPDTLLVGFKLESDVDQKTLLQRAAVRMESSGAEMMVANSSDSLYTHAAVHYIMDREGHVVECSSKEETAKQIIREVARRASKLVEIK
ncbi:phosphopantothenoylcysteine decarboxylase [Ectobacillus panaciterrae]|uniref:phosphopantothenoylcysteine decarboxylase domain-containing protein n=1 Tax=Ectobacillus panaciterrae TaxID=363872 RepID=UPI00040F3798|nr:phosphopantothenoylcysteine decarboxylase [Ectobacillus panaciterrae]